VDAALTADHLNRLYDIGRVLRDHCGRAVEAGSANHPVEEAALKAEQVAGGSRKVAGSRVHAAEHHLVPLKKAGERDAALAPGSSQNTADAQRAQSGDGRRGGFRGAGGFDDDIGF
jgi:hypothetical protein